MVHIPNFLEQPWNARVGILSGLCSSYFWSDPLSIKVIPIRNGPTPSYALYLQVPYIPVHIGPKSRVSLSFSFQLFGRFFCKKVTFSFPTLIIPVKDNCSTD